MQFSNYFKEWETDRIGLESGKCCSSLFEKYLYNCLYFEGGVRRVMGAVRSAASRPAKYQVVAKFNEVIQTVVKDGKQESGECELTYQRRAPQLY